jgi:hypothetical protein
MKTVTTPADLRMAEALAIDPPPAVRFGANPERERARHACATEAMRNRDQIGRLAYTASTPEELKALANAVERLHKLLARLTELGY